MNVDSRLTQIRESERKSHIAMYANEELYTEGSWLRKPIKTVLDLIPLLGDCRELHVLDLGCGVGRNCICIAQHYRDIPCSIDCVDILEFAIEKLRRNAEEYGVSSRIHGIVKPIDDYVIQKNHYDLILAVSALEHVDSKASLEKKLKEIRDGVRDNGIVCYVFNSNVRETDKSTGTALPAQFEVNLPTDELQAILADIYFGWKVIKSTVQEQQYDIPRENSVSELRTSVVTFTARK